MARRRNAKGQFVRSGGGGGSRRSGRYYQQRYGGRRRSSGFSFSLEDILEGALYSVGLDFLGAQLDARGVELPLGLDGREGAGFGALWWGRKKRSKKWVIAGLLNSGPAIKELTAGVASGFLGDGAPQLGGGGGAPQLGEGKAGQLAQSGGNEAIEVLDRLLEAAGIDLF
jgi:hypothetical protein